MPAQPTQKKLLTKAEAARLLGVCRPTLYTMIEEKRLTPVRITATQTRIRTEDIEKILGSGISTERRIM
jgi:excisionase family DNA binding protein